MKVKISIDVETAADCPNVYEESKEVANEVAQAILERMSYETRKKRSWWAKSVKILTVDCEKIGLKFKCEKK